MAHSSACKLVTVEGEVLWLSKGKIDRLVGEGFAFWVTDRRARMLGGDVKRWRGRKSGEAGPTVMQLVDV